LRPIRWPPELAANDNAILGYLCRGLLISSLASSEIHLHHALPHGSHLSVACRHCPPMKPHTLRQLVYSVVQLICQQIEMCGHFSDLISGDNVDPFCKVTLATFPMASTVF
jgi:hypothetical protein